MTFVKIQALRFNHDLDAFEPSDFVLLNADRIVSVEKDSSSYRYCVEVEGNSYLISADEYTRLEAILIGTPAPAEEKPQSVSLSFTVTPELKQAMLDYSKTPSLSDEEDEALRAIARELFAIVDGDAS